MPSVAIRLSEYAYLPEAYAYQNHLRSKGWQVDLALEFASNYDVDIRFMGFAPFWGNYNASTALVLEYHSLSTGRLPRVKNVIKAALEKRPAARIFLNDTVRQGFQFRSPAPYLNRDMGVDEAFFYAPGATPEFDLVYAGSFAGRPGLVGEIRRLTTMGLSMLLVGDIPNDVYELFKPIPTITMTGRAKREEMPSLYRRARAGLNFTPNVYPLNRQTSTKTLEYCASGLGIVSTRYSWAEYFASSRSGTFLWNDQITSKQVFDDFPFRTPPVFDLEWNRLLEQIGFEPFIRSLIGRQR